MVDDQVGMLGIHNYFNTLYQIYRDEDSINKTTFITPTGQYELLQMVFEFTNALNEVANLMVDIFNCYTNKKEAFYLKNN